MLIAVVQTEEKVQKACLNTLCSSDPFCGLLVCHVIDLDLDQSLIDQSIMKSTKYFKYQKSILYMKRVLYILRKICVMIEAITNITNEKKYWLKYKYCIKYYKYGRKFYKYGRKCYKYGRKYYKYGRKHYKYGGKYYQYDRKYYKNIQSFMNI